MHNNNDNLEYYPNHMEVMIQYVLTMLLCLSVLLLTLT